VDFAAKMASLLVFWKQSSGGFLNESGRAPEQMAGENAARLKMQLCDALNQNPFLT